MDRGAWQSIVHGVKKSQTRLKRLTLSLSGFPHSSVGKELACNARDLSSIPGSGRSPEEGNDNPLQYSCLENSMDRGAWQSIVHKVAKSWTQLSN